MATETRHEQILNFAVSVGALMLKSGAETYRVEDTITRILNAHHFRTVDSFAVPTGIMVTIEGDTFSLSTKIARVKNRATRLDRLEKLNQLSRDYVSGRITLEEGNQILEEISKTPGYSPRTVTIWLAVSAAFFAIMFNGNVTESILSFLIGLGIGFIQDQLNQKNIINFLVFFICALFLGFCATICHFIDPGIHIEPVIIGCMMPLLPGVAFTTAVRDALGDELLSSIARGIDAILTAIALAAGIGLSLSISHFIGAFL